MWLSAALSRFGIAVEGGPLGTNLPQTPEFLVLKGVRRGSLLLVPRIGSCDIVSLIRGRFVHDVHRHRIWLSTRNSAGRHPAHSLVERYRRLD